MSWCNLIWSFGGAQRSRRPRQPSPRPREKARKIQHVAPIDDVLDVFLSVRVGFAGLSRVLICQNEIPIEATQRSLVSGRPPSVPRPPFPRPGPASLVVTPSLSLESSLPLCPPRAHRAPCSHTKAASLARAGARTGRRCHNDLQRRAVPDRRRAPRGPLRRDGRSGPPGAFKHP